MLLSFLYKSLKYSSVSFLFLSLPLRRSLLPFRRSLPPLCGLLLPLHSCLPCENLQDAGCSHPVPNFWLKIGEHPASFRVANIVCLKEISNEWCIPSKQQRCNIFQVYAGFRDCQGMRVKNTVGKFVGKGIYNADNIIRVGRCFKPFAFSVL